MEFEKKHAGWKLLILRLVIGAIFIAHGLAKWGMWQAAPSDQMPAVMLWVLRILSIVEPVFGVLTILGAGLPIVGLVFAIIMIGAIYFKITVIGVQFTGGWSYELLILAASLVMASSGGGKFSADEMMMKKKMTTDVKPNQPATPAQRSM